MKEGPDVLGPEVLGPVPEGRLLTTRTGTSFFLRELGRGNPTVFLHGGGPGCTGWSDFGGVAPLFARDRRCILVDLLQYGLSDSVSILGPMWDTHAVELVALFDVLELGEVDLVCNSWGGSAALNLAALYPTRVRRVVVTGAMPVLHGATTPLPDQGARGRIARDEYFGGSGPSLEKMRMLMAGLEWFDPALIPEETVALRYEQSIAGDEIAIYNEPARRGVPQDLSHRLASIEATTLVCWGRYDAFLGPDYALMVSMMIPRGRLYVMENCGHHLQEERPRVYHQVVSGFLDEDRS